MELCATYLKLSSAESLEVRRRHGRGGGEGQEGEGWEGEGSCTGRSSSSRRGSRCSSRSSWNSSNTRSRSSYSRSRRLLGSHSCLLLGCLLGIKQHLQEVWLGCLGLGRSSEQGREESDLTCP